MHVYNTTCFGPDSIPDLELQYPIIPKNINYAFVPAGDGNTSSPWMVNCCTPPISLIDNCYIWCEMPGGKDAPPGELEQQFIMTRFTGCVKRNGRQVNQSAITAWHFGGDAARVRDGAKGLLLCVVLALSVLVVMV